MEIQKGVGVKGMGQVSSVGWIVPIIGLVPILGLVPAKALPVSDVQAQNDQATPDPLLPKATSPSILLEAAVPPIVTSPSAASLPSSIPYPDLSISASIPTTPEQFELEQPEPKQPEPVTLRLNEFKNKLQPESTSEFKPRRVQSELIQSELGNTEPLDKPPLGEIEQTSALRNRSINSPSSPQVWESQISQSSPKPADLGGCQSCQPAAFLSPRLHGEAAPVPEFFPELAASPDPLEQLSTEEWLQLISEDEAPVQAQAVQAQTVQARSAQISSPQTPVQSVPLSLSHPQEFIDPLTYDSSNLFAEKSPSKLYSSSTLNSLFLPDPLEAGVSSSLEEDLMAQVTSVSQLSDVRPTDWAYQALQSLVERYGIIVGYPDGTFRGERALTRYEFAAGVNAAMERITELTVNNTRNGVTQADLEIIQRLQDDFSSELMTLRGRLDGLEARITEIDAHQFSTTVVLNGETTFGLANAWGGNPPGLGESNPVFAYLTRLQLAGSFSQRDTFRLELEAGNFAGGGFAEPEALNTQMALMGWQSDTGNTVELSSAEYRFAVGDRLVFALKPVGFGLDSVLSPNSIFSSSTQGALSRFAAQTPILRIGSLDAGLGLDLLMTNRTRLQIAYGARNASDPEEGLFSSDHRALGVQLLARPFRALTTGLAYVNAFAADGFLDTFTGSTNADTSGGFDEPAAIHALGGTLQWEVAPSIVLAAWGGATLTDSLSSDAVALSTTYQFSLGFPDTFGREGDLLGVMVGQPFRLRYGFLVEREDETSGLHYEVFYRIRVNDNIAITPGIFLVSDPGHIADNDTIVVGAIRTSFSF